MSYSQHLLPTNLSNVPLTPLPQQQQGMSPETKKLLIIAVVVLTIAIIWYYSTRGSKEVKRMERNRTVQRLTTKELAGRLYERLEKRKGTNAATLRSLERYAKKG
jgi:hypothetical protein